MREREGELHATRPRLQQLEAELDTSQEELKLERKLNRKLKASLGLLRRGMSASTLSPPQQGDSGREPLPDYERQI